MPYLYWKRFPSPWGTLRLFATPEGLCLLALPAGGPVASWMGRHLSSHTPIEGGDLLREAAAQLEQYVARERRSFDLPLDLRGTPFQLQVWQALLEIPYGQTRSYAQVADAIGRPRAVRAVGAANGANPLPIIIPCHRVVRSDGSLGGYGGGLPLKRALLRLEGGGEVGPPPSGGTHAAR
ncbi:MAG: methylated-DNA--[protein]-cysteine S-methyltransferase [Chloroflexia bacterium]|nr:methylated-DNA--[protein]-cysteine S-methyltransferase [Chloroflexia bacterium]